MSGKKAMFWFALSETIGFSLFHQRQRRIGKKGSVIPQDLAGNGLG